MKINRILYKFSEKYRQEIDKKVAERETEERLYWAELVREAEADGSITIFNHL